VKIANLVFLVIAALGEIAGCFSFWAWLRLEKSVFWILLGICALIIFAIALTKVDLPNAARVYAAYGGIYL
jgi:small multidrug resistance family-3 protein